MPEPLRPSSNPTSVSRPVDYPKSEVGLGKEFSQDERLGYSMDGELIAAKYLPYIRYIARDGVHATLQKGRIVAQDSNGQLVPANGLPDGLTEYPGAPLFYSDLDLGTGGGPANFTPDLTPMESGDLIDVSGSRKMVEGAALGSNAGVLESGTSEVYIVGVPTTAKPLGVLFDTALDGGARDKNINFSPDDQHTIVMREMWQFSELAANRISYRESIANHLYDLETNVFGDADSSVTMQPYTNKPDWVPDLPSGPIPFEDSATIRSGDFVACNHNGELVKLDGGVNLTSTRTDDNSNDVIVPDNMPFACVTAIVGRCTQRRAVALGGLATVATAGGARVAGGSRPNTSNRGRAPLEVGATATFLVRVCV